MNKIEIIGHRGARAYAPENTIPAYKISLEQGVDCIDVDVVVTSDKALIGYHDPLINPDILCDNNGVYLAQSKAILHENLDKFNLNDILIKNLSLKQIQDGYLVQLNPDSPYAKWFPEQQSVPNTRISSLQEIVNFVNKYSDTIAIQIEVKNDFEHPEWSYTPAELAQILYNFILQNNLIERIKVQAFDWRILALLNQLNPKIKTAYLDSYILDDSWQKWFADSIIMDAAKNMKVKQLKSLMNLVKYLGAYSYEVEDSELTYEETKLAKKLGLKIFVWGWPEHSGFVYNVDLIVKLINWKIDGFITDKPDELRSLLYKMGYSVPSQIKVI